MDSAKLAIINANALEQAAKIMRARDLTPFGVQKFTLDLSVARSEANPFVIGFPFKTIWLKNGTTNNSNVLVKFNKNDSGIERVELQSNDIIKSDDMFAQAFLSWSAQSGESIDVYVFVSADIQTGSLLNSGTVTLAPATAISTPARVVASDTGLIKVPANANAKKVMLENAGINDIKFGGNGTTNSGATTDGITLAAGNSVTLDCTADIYVVCATGLTSNIQYIYLS